MANAIRYYVVLTRISNPFFQLGMYISVSLLSVTKIGQAKIVLFLGAINDFQILWVDGKLKKEEWFCSYDDDLPDGTCYGRLAASTSFAASLPLLILYFCVERSCFLKPKGYWGEEKKKERILCYNSIMLLSGTNATKSYQKHLENFPK